MKCLQLLKDNNKLIFFLIFVNYYNKLINFKILLKMNNNVSALSQKIMKNRHRAPSQISSKQNLTEYRSRLSYVMRNKRKTKKGNIVNKMYGIKFLSRKCNFYMKENVIRMLEYNIPTLIELHPESDTKDYPFYSYFWSQINFKRIVQYEFNSSNNVYNFIFEERWSKKSNGNELMQFLRGLNLLRSFADEETKKLSQKMEQQLNFANKCSMQVESLKQSSNSLIDSKDNIQKKLTRKEVKKDVVRLVPEKDDSQRKIYHIKLEKETWSIIKRVPFISLIEVFNTSNNEFEQKGFTYNKLQLDYMGNLKVNQIDVFEGFEPLSRVKSQNWVLFFNQLIDFKLNETRTTQHLCKEALHLENPHEKILKGTFNMYKQVHLVKNMLTYEIYFALNGEEP